MRADELKAILGRRPFLPVRLLITSGEHYDVRHPEQVMVWAGSVVFAIGPKLGVPEQIGYYSLIHVVKVIPLDAIRRRKRRRRTGA